MDQADLSAAQIEAEEQTSSETQAGPGKESLYHEASE